MKNQDNIIIEQAERTDHTPCINPMTIDEAQAKHDSLKNLQIVARSILLEMRDRQGWKALGYKSFVDYGAECFGYSTATLYRLAKAGEMQNDFDSPIGEIPETHLRPLASVTPELRQQIFNLAEQWANDHNTPLTASIVQMSVNEYKQRLEESEKRVRFLEKQNSDQGGRIYELAEKKIAEELPKRMEAKLPEMEAELSKDYIAKIDDQKDEISRLHEKLALTQQADFTDNDNDITAKQAEAKKLQALIDQKKEQLETVERSLDSQLTHAELLRDYEHLIRQITSTAQPLMVKLSDLKGSHKPIELPRHIKYLLTEAARTFHSYAAGFEFMATDFSQKELP